MTRIGLASSITYRQKKPVKTLIWMGSRKALTVLTNVSGKGEPVLKSSALSLTVMVVVLVRNNGPVRYGLIVSMDN